MMAWGKNGGKAPNDDGKFKTVMCAFFLKGQQEWSNGHKICFEQ